jgi:hypothetical protein
MQLNGFDIVDRHNRPNVSQRVGLKTFFINDGVYADPIEVSSVTLFKAASNLSPCSILDANGVIDINGVSGSVLMTYANSSLDTLDLAFSSINYKAEINVGTGVKDAKNASGIYRTGVGEYVVVLDNTIELSGVVASGTESEDELANAASSVDNYIDVWTVRFSPGSTFTTFINTFKLHNDTINIFKDSVITDASMEIKKLNEDPNLPSRVSVETFSNTEDHVSITSDNTLIYTWNTGKLNEVVDIGSQTGVYSVQAKYWVLNQLIYTPLFNVIVN